jgi:hypothetical protein
MGYQRARISGTMCWLPVVKRWFSEYSTEINAALTLAIAFAAWAQCKVGKRQARATEKTNELQDSVIKLQREVFESSKRLGLICGVRRDRQHLVADFANVSGIGLLLSYVMISFRFPEGTEHFNLDGWTPRVLSPNEQMSFVITPFIIEILGSRLKRTHDGSNFVDTEIEFALKMMGIFMEGEFERSSGTYRAAFVRGAVEKFDFVLLRD